MIQITETELKEILMSYFCIGDSDTYQLTIAKEAFYISTMTLDDFVEWYEDQVDNLIKYIKNKIEIKKFERGINNG